MLIVEAGSFKPTVSKMSSRDSQATNETANPSKSWKTNMCPMKIQMRA